MAALCLALPAAGAAQGLPDFLTTVGDGIEEGVERSAARIAASMEQELGLTLGADSSRIEAGTMLTLTVTAQNPRITETPVAFALSLPERLACGEETQWEAILPAAAAGEDGEIVPSVTTFTRTLALKPGGVSEQALITCEMSMGTRFYRAQQTIDLCVADVAVTAALEGSEAGRLEPGDTFAWRLEVTNAGMAAEDVALTLVLPEGVTPDGALPEGFVLAGGRLTGTVRAQSAEVDDTGAAASLETVMLLMKVSEDALEGDRDAVRLMAGTLYASGERVPLPRIQVCGPMISAQLITEERELEMGEETVLRVMVINEGLAGADVSLSCALPEGLELIAAKEREEEEKTVDKAAATLPPSDGGTGPDGAPVLAQTAQTLEEMTAENNTVVLNWHMDAAKETDEGLTAATRVFELPVRAVQEQENLEERLVGATLAYSVDGGDMQLGEATAMRLYTPSFLGVARDDWGGIFWACVLMMITVGCLYGAVRAGSSKDEYFCCE